MKTIKVISLLDINDGHLATKSLKNYNQVFLQQGSIDGACGPYTLLMALLILGLIDYDQATDMWWEKKSTRFGKLIKSMQTHDTLFQSGTDLEDLKHLVDNSFKKNIDIALSESKGKQVVNFVLEELKSNKPVIIGINGKELAHWMLAIGFEEDEHGQISKIFFLDPSQPNKSNYWIASINIKDTYHGRYPYQWVDQSEETLISFEHAMSLGSK